MHRSFAALRMTWLLVFVFTSTLVLAQAPNDARAPIRELLDKQAAAWNRGDLEGFMAGYWRSPELTFFSGNKITRGWEPTLQRYREKYQSAGKEMGKLDFSELRIDVFAPDAGAVRGHWHLVMKDGSELGGLFTLMLRKLPEGWHIVHDHTS